MTRTPAPETPSLPWPLRHRRLTLLLCVAAMLLGIASALTLRPGTAVRDMLPAQSPAAAALDRALADFRLIDDLLLVVETADPNGPSDSEALAHFAEAVASAFEDDDDIAYVRWTHDDQEALRAITEQLTWSQAWWRLDEAQRRGVIERLTPDAMRSALANRERELAAPGARLAEWQQALQNDPLGLLAWLRESAGPDAAGLPLTPNDHAATPAPNALQLSNDGRALLVRIGGTQPANDLAYTQALVRRVNKAAEVANAATPTELTWRITGPYAIADFSAASTKRDMIISILISMALISGLFFLVFRDHRTWPMTLLTVNGGIVVAFGLYAFGQGRLSPVTATCGAVLAGLGIDYCVHLISHAKSRRRVDLAAALRTMTPVLAAACLTSAIGFAAVAAAGVRALTEFAVLGVMGLIATLAMTITFLPAALAHDGGAKPEESDEPTATPQQRGIMQQVHRAVHAVFDRPRPWLFGCAMVGGMGAAWLVLHGTATLRFADDLEAMHAVPNPPIETQAEISERFGLRPSVVFVHVTADTPESLLQRTTTLQQNLDRVRQSQPHVHAAWGLADLLAMPGDTSELPDASNTLAAFDAAVTESRFRPEAFAGFRERLALALKPPDQTPWQALRDTPGVAQPLLPRSFFEGTPADQTLAVVTLDTPWELLDDRAALLADLNAAVVDVPGAALTGLAVVGAEMQSALRTATQRLVWITALAVVVWLCLFFRNPWEVIAALFPAALGLLVLTVCIDALGIELHAANLVALPLTLGLGVDDGIFLVAIARRVRRSRGTVAELREGLAQASGAIVLTSLTTLLAFGSLVFTQTPAIQSLGLLTAIGVGTCLFTSLFGLVPALALSHTRRNRTPRRSPSS